MREGLDLNRVLREEVEVRKRAWATPRRPKVPPRGSAWCGFEKVRPEYRRSSSRLASGRANIITVQEASRPALKLKVR